MRTASPTEIKLRIIASSAIFNYPERPTINALFFAIRKRILSLTPVCNSEIYFFILIKLPLDLNSGFFDRLTGHNPNTFFHLEAVCDGDMVAEYSIIKLTVVADLAVIR